MAAADGNSSDELSSSVLLPEDSAGSSVSSRLQEEYDELLRYAVVTPNVPLVHKSNGLIDDKQEDKSNLAEKMTNIRYHTSPKETVIRHFVDPEDEDEEQNLRVKKSFVTVISDEDSENSQNSILSNLSQAQSPSIDADLARLENQMNSWSLDFKRNILAEFTQSKLGLISKYKELIKEEKERHVIEIEKYNSEIESLKELLSTYEHSIQRKDCVVSDLTKALEKQRERLALSQQFCKWKLHLFDKKREAFATKLATKHYRRTIAGRAWVAWHGVVEAKWRQRVEKSCQARAQEVCMALTEEYEQKLAALSRKYEDSRAEIARMQKERQHYEETMKKAFMRGVCALNLEAMTMFQEAAMASEEEASPDRDNVQPGIAISKEFMDSVSQWTQNRTLQIHQPNDVPAQPHLVTDLNNRSKETNNQNKATIKAALATRNQLPNPAAKVKVERHSDSILTPHGDVLSKKRSAVSKKALDSKSRKTAGAISKSAHLIKVVE
ncbi:Centrosomal protein POC5 [Trichoplax sp. H2]|nr:Centrosomal protein POC5 [Trichoplax sp. H2]|eukprot:RDD47535.1 Centrosomal protein POC5 [Trichoplax sp. H2]